MLTTSARLSICRAATRRVAIAAATRPFFYFRFFSAAPVETNVAPSSKIATTVVKPTDAASPPAEPSTTVLEKDLPISYADISRAHVVSILLRQH